MNSYVVACTFQGQNCYVVPTAYERPGEETVPEPHVPKDHWVPEKKRAMKFDNREEAEAEAKRLRGINPNWNVRVEFLEA